jgi:hypothetical protein
MASTLTLTLVALFFVGCGQSAPEPAPGADPAAAGADEPPEALTGAYLGQPLPGEQPQLFAGGIVSTGMSERDLTMTPDGTEIYFSAQVGREATFSAIVVTRQVDGKWTLPEVAPFSGQYFDLEPAVSPDGGRFFFVSNRPREGSNQPVADEDIWVMEREGAGWSAPHNLGPPVNTDNPEFFPSVTLDGTLYYTAKGDDGKEAIYRARPLGGGFSEPERLGPEVNSGKARFNAFVAPDESFLILPIFGREDSIGAVDYYVVFRSEDDRWSEPINLGDKINTPTGAEWSASLSPDGKALFFMSSRSVIVNRRAPRRMSYDEVRKLHDLSMNGNPDIWWVDAAAVRALRPSGF